MKKISTLELCYGAIFICLMAIGANITYWFPFLSVPIGGVSVPLSLQTFFSILAGLMLGKKLGAFSIFAYTLVGLIGVPVFAQMQSGLFVLFNYTGGFLLSFILVAYVTGYLVERLTTITLLLSTSIAIIGVITNYLVGVTYMYIGMNTWLNLEITYLTAWLGMIPFLIKDLCLAFIAALLIMRMHQRLSFKTSHIKTL
ncbi:biotin transporter BioY [Amphibacillus cookii]|uniref:biotin transporter BioY n=1 Tax=Amphibacillus cookii TaxID=767787 RepID=UPI001956F694|nr:biotin transporter BioY [Amphibacillus cookii]MBM7541422.1 biotin transport system substrate-specific component [Amphibacillus cookii]